MKSFPAQERGAHLEHPVVIGFEKGELRVLSDDPSPVDTLRTIERARNLLGGDPFDVRRVLPPSSRADYLLGDGMGLGDV